MAYPNSNIILFDGVCNLCNGFVQFIIRRDPEGIFRFASLQSEAARRLLTDHGYSGYPLESVVFIQNGKTYEMSAAVLQIFKTLGGLWQVFSIFRIVPEGFRNKIYRFIARRRYHWFGKKAACMVPTPRWQQRFLS